MTRGIARIALVLALAGCGAPATLAREPAPAALAEPIPPPGPSWAHAPDLLARRMRELAARAAAHGALPEPALDVRAFLAARGTRAVPLEIPSGACWTIATLASGGMRDLDARLFTEDGDVVAEDVAPDPHPTLQACAGPDEPRRLWLVLDAYDGSGGVLVAALRTPREALAEMRDELGGAPGQSLELAPRAALEEALARRGFELREAPVEVPLAAAQRVRVPLRTRAGRCYAVVARPRAPLERVALRVLDLSGAPLVEAGDRAREPAVQLCASEDVERAIEIAAVEGEGTVALVIAEGDDDAIGGEAGLWLGVPPPGEVARPTGTIRGRLARGESAAHTLRLPRGCSRVRARAGPGIARLELASGDEAADGPREAALELCGPARTIDVRITVRGAGEYAIDVSRGAL